MPEWETSYTMQQVMGMRGALLRPHGRSGRDVPCWKQCCETTETAVILLQGPASLMLHAEGASLGCLTGLAPQKVLRIKATSSPTLHLHPFILAWHGLPRADWRCRKGDVTERAGDVARNRSIRIGHGVQDAGRF
jgi:hypothetical protein